MIANVEFGGNLPNAWFPEGQGNTRVGCGCCRWPNQIRIVLQHVSFNRECNTFCFVREVPIGTRPPEDGGFDFYDRLIGPWQTNVQSTGSISLSFEAAAGDPGFADAYESNYSRTTSAFFAYKDTTAPDEGCPCEQSYDETQSSGSKRTIENSGYDCWVSGYGEPEPSLLYWTDIEEMTCNQASGSGASDGLGGAFNPGGGEFGGGGASGSWGEGSTDPNFSALPEEINKYITGAAPYMTAEQIKNLVNTLRQYEQTTGNQLTLVFTPNNPNGTYDPFALAEQYGVGRGEGTDSGIVVFVHPESRNWQVATGYGMEADITDIVSNQIMSAAFGSGASGDIFGSVSQAVQGFTGISTPNTPNTGGVGDGTTQQGQNCELECPPTLNQPDTVLFGGGVQGSVTNSYTYGRSGQTTCEGAPEFFQFLKKTFPESTSETTPFGENCEPGGCPIPYPWSFTGLGSVNIPGIYGGAATTVYGGESAACVFSAEAEEVLFPDYRIITRLEPANFAGQAGFAELGSPFLLPGQGYLASSYRFAQGQNGRYKSQSEQHVKWRIAHNPIAGCYLKVWFAKKITLTRRGIYPTEDLPSIVQYEDAGTYTWDSQTVEDGRCIKNGLGAYDVQNIVYGPDNIVPIPQPSTGARELGRTEEIFIKKISAVKGYEPPNHPEDKPLGLETKDISISPDHCLSCGSYSQTSFDDFTGEPIGAFSLNGQSEAWSCPFRFIPELVDPAYPPCCAGHNENATYYPEYYALPVGCDPAP